MRSVLAVISTVAALALVPATAVAQDPPEGAALSRDGTRAAWAAADGHSVWSAQRAGQDAAWSAPRTLFTIRGTVAELTFSPSGQQLAFENARTNHAFIAVYDLPANRIMYVDPVFATDSDPVWSADGSRLSFVRRVAGVADQQLTRPAPVPAGWTPPPARPDDTYPFQDLLAAPITYAPVRSADGRSIAYITRETTLRAVNFMRVGGQARRVAVYPDDDGIELNQLAVSRDGGAVAYVRGPAPNSDGDLPNPRSFPVPPTRRVWIVGADAADPPRLVGDGFDPQFAPDDSFLIYTHGGDPWRVALTWDANGRLVDVGPPTRVFNPPAEPSSVRFSPDGSMFAYVRSSRVGVFDFATNQPWLVDNPGGTDLNPIWSPDGTKLAFRRTLTDQRWGIGVMDVATRQTRLIWQAPAGVGSTFYGLDANPTFVNRTGDQLFWSANDKLVFPWEGDGFRHLYSIPVSGGEPTLLTPGEGEVESASISLDGTRVIYSTNIGDLGRRHLASVSVDGGPVTPVTSGRESQWAPTPLADGKLAFVNAGWASPPLVQVADGAGAAVPASLPQLPASFPAEHLVEPELVEFPATDGLKAYGQLFVPKHPDGCAVIFPHGGPRRAMLPGFHYYDTYSNLYELNQYLASQGCVVLSVDYRGGIMHGYEFRNAPGRTGTSASEYRDVLGGVAFLKQRADVDPERIGIHGLSHGGYLASLALARDSDVFKVGFDMAGVHTAAIADIDGWRSPVMLVQGDDDRNVSFAHGMNLASALMSRRPQVELVQRAFPNEVHDLYLTYEDLVETYVPGANFLLDHLKPDATPPTEVSDDVEVGAPVAPTLALTLGAPSASFGAFTAGVSKQYTAATTATVISTAGDAALTLSDPGHLANGSFQLPSPLEVELSKASWTGPVSNEAVAVTFRQRIAASDALRTGFYSRAVTFTLSTTTP